MLAGRFPRLRLALPCLCLHAGSVIESRFAARNAVPLPAAAAAAKSPGAFAATFAIRRYASLSSHAASLAVAELIIGQHGNVVAGRGVYQFCHELYTLAGCSFVVFR